MYKRMINISYGISLILFFLGNIIFLLNGLELLNEKLIYIGYGIIFLGVTFIVMIGILKLLKGILPISTDVFLKINYGACFIMTISLVGQLVMCFFYVTGEKLWLFEMSIGSFLGLIYTYQKIQIKYQYK